jgi:hypothetical protein
VSRWWSTWSWLVVGVAVLLMMVGWVVLTTVFGTFTNGPVP